MPRAMAFEDFRLDQWEHRFDPHVAPINGLVDRLSDPDGRDWMPYVAPMHGGTDARVLALGRDPRPATQRNRGSGFLSVENDDPAAEAVWHLLDGAHIDPRSVLLWNAYPWYITHTPTATELDEGVRPLARLIALAPSLRVVLLLGSTARESWRRLLQRFPETAGGLRAVPSPRPRRGLSAERVLQQAEAFRLARQLLH